MVVAIVMAMALLWVLADYTRLRMVQVAPSISALMACPSEEPGRGEAWPWEPSPGGHVLISAEAADLQEFAPPLSGQSATLVRIPAAAGRTLRLVHSKPKGGPLLIAGQARVWPAALALVDELLEKYTSQLQAGARVIELGCGLGLPALVCAALGACTLLTDVPEALPLLQQRIEENFNDRSTGIQGDISVDAAALRWEASAASALAKERQGFDLVLCSDCVYEPLYGDSWQKLAETIGRLCAHKHGTVALISLQRRPGEFEDASDGVDEFLQALRQDCVVEQVWQGKEPGSSKLEIYSAQRAQAD